MRNEPAHFVDERVELLCEFERLLDQFVTQTGELVGSRSDVRATKRGLAARELAVRSVARQVAPDLEAHLTGWVWRTSRALKATVTLRGALEHGTRVASTLPDVPALVHRGLWSESGPLWASSPRAAVQAAGTYIEELLASRIGRDDVSGVALVNEALSLDHAASGRPRLRWPAHPLTSERGRSEAQGMLAFARGCVQCFRNGAVHSSAPLDEVDAMQQLVTLSLLARRIDQAQVEQYDDRT